MGRLDGKVVLISGTAGGQGRAAALAFAKEGARVFGCDVKAAEAEETVALVRAAGGEMRSLQPLDVSDLDNAKRWAKAASDAWGGIDVLYNNAGSLCARGPFASSTLEEWNLTVRYELTILYTSTIAAWPYLVARGGGLVISTASMSGHREMMPLRTAAHGACKAGVMGFTRMLAAEGAPHKIRAVSISPGLIRSPATERFWSGDDEQQATGAGMVAKIPMGRYGLPEEIANVAVFLATAEASFINGTDILVDGGMTGVSFSSQRN
ncbi:MAG TPA: SDR family NAD(P)-dependent oxidoreductase [Stellaceae bacterium]|nr:SDR family NAD(P)-dependent oxidoreductase [Stellaceae bacterium]